MCGVLCRVKDEKIIEHLKSSDHDNKILNDNERAPTDEDLVAMMERLFENKDKISDGVFLKKCNRMKEIHSYWANERKFKRKWCYELSDFSISIYYTDHLGKMFKFRRRFRSY